MTNGISICEFPPEILDNILLQFDDVESLKAAVISCDAFYSILHENPSILQVVLENQITQPLLPYAYAVLKCEQEGLGTASDEAKGRLLDTVYDGDEKTEFQALFPDSKLTWPTALSLGSFHNIVKRLTLRAARGAARAIRYEARMRANAKRLETFGSGELILSKAETLRFHLAFYRVELHSRLFSTTHGAQLSHDMEASFFDRLEPWEAEQCMIVEDWMNRTIRKAASRLRGDTLFFDYRCWRFLDSGYAIALGLRSFDTICSSISTQSLRRLIRRYTQDPLIEDPVTVFSTNKKDGAMDTHMRRVTEDLFSEVASETTDPNFGQRSALSAVYGAGALILQEGRVLRAEIVGRWVQWYYEKRVRSLFYPFWDNARIADGHMLPFFAAVAHERRQYNGKAERDAMKSGAEYCEDEDEDDSGGEEEDGLILYGCATWVTEYGEYACAYNQGIEDYCDDGDTPTFGVSFDVDAQVESDICDRLWGPPDSNQESLAEAMARMPPWLQWG